MKTIDVNSAIDWDDSEYEPKIFYTSDLHLGHKNILEYEHRPFKDVDDMTEEIIKKWNNKVGKRDFVYILGDFAFKNQYMNKAKILECFKRLNGIKILVKGNHDNYLTKEFVEDLRYDDNNTSIDNDSIIEILDKKRIVVLCHYPIEEWDGKYHGTYHVHGHIHSRDIIKHIPKRFNCGVDVRNFEPVTLDEMIDATSK